jgi:hypothetical protein
MVAPTATRPQPQPQPHPPKPVELRRSDSVLTDVGAPPDIVQLRDAILREKASSPVQTRALAALQSAPLRAALRGPGSASKLGGLSFRGQAVALLEASRRSIPGAGPAAGHAAAEEAVAEVVALVPASVFANDDMEDGLF